MSDTAKKYDIDFRALKESFSVPLLISHYDLKLTKGGNEWRGNCPLPTHPEQASQNTFSINEHTKLWSCKAKSCVKNRGGRSGGDIIDLVKLMEGVNTRDAALKLQSIAGDDQETGAPEPSQNPSEPRGEPQATGDRTWALAALRDRQEILHEQIRVRQCELEQLCVEYKALCVLFRTEEN